MKILWLLLLIITCCTILLAREKHVEKRTYRATPVNPHPPQIDGKLNEPIWQKAALAGDFVQYEPHEGQAPDQNTTFQIAFDPHNLYLAIRAHDTEPEKIVRRVARRDQGEDADLVSILIDSYFDKRTAFEFTVNVAGVKIDGIWADDGDSKDYSWDPVWYVATSLDSAGWTAEIRIPFNQLRFDNKKEEHVWGLEIGRYLHRKQEWSLWQPVPQESGGFVSQIGELHGLRGVSMPRRIELLPYSLGQVEFSRAEAGNPFADGREGKFAAGLDGKVGLSSDLTLDFTVNPDFGQVEADPSEVNLTAFETFFREKRPFFIEGKNIFNYNLGWGDGSFSRETLFYSRRIGRQPHHDPALNDHEYADIPHNTSIISAAKLTGKTRSGFSIALLDAVTAREYASIYQNGQTRSLEVEPLSNYFVGRLQKDYDRGNTSLGGMMTAAHRDIHETHLNFLNKAAYTGGLDFNHQWNHKNYMFNIRTAASRIEGSPEAILEAQTASQRYFQRPDASHVRLDSSRTFLNGHAGAFTIGKVGGGHWRYVAAGIWRSPGFEVNDLGYLRKADRAMAYTWIAYREWNPRWIFRRFQINFNLWEGWNFAPERIFSGGNINGNGQFKNYWSFGMGINRESAELRDSELRGGPMMKFPGAWSNWYSLSSDERKKLRFGLGGYNQFNDAGGSRYHDLWLELNWRPDNAVAFYAGPFYRYNKDNLQYVDTQTHPTTGQKRYIMALLEQETFGVQFRIDLSITPNLTIQYYGQPFISAGKYSQFKRVTEPRAVHYGDRFHTFGSEEISLTTLEGGDRIYEVDENRDGAVDYRFDYPDFNFWEFRSNLVVRWEYLPGSTLYLVWTQNRSDDAPHGDFSICKGFKNLFNIYPDNVILIKMNYWFSL